MKTLAVRVLLVVTCVGLATMFAVPDDGEPTAEEKAYVESFVRRFRQAQSLLGSSKDAEAETLLRELLAEEPEAAAVHHALGTLLRFRGRADEAGESFANAAELAPDDGVIRRDAGLHLLALGDGPAAEPHLAVATKLLPDDVEALTGHGAALRLLGRQAAAVAAYQAAMRLQPESVDARVGLAACLIRSDPAEALRVLAPVPGHFADASLAHGMALMSLTRFDEAVAHLVQSSRVAPAGRAGLPFLRDAAEGLVRCGAAPEAAAAARRWTAAEGERRTARSSFCLALAEAAVGRAGPALAALDAAPGLDRAAPDVQAHFGLFRAAVLLEAGRPEDARPVLETLAARPDAAFERGAALRLLGRADEADLAAAARAERDPGARRNDVAWIESLVAAAEGRTEDRRELRRSARELSRPPGEFPGLLVR